MADEDLYEIPLQDQRVFGAGIKRKRVQFVPSTTTTTIAPSNHTPARSIGDLYLNLVLPADTGATSDETSAPRAISQDPPSLARAEGEESSWSRTCEICKLPFSSPPDPSSRPITQDSSNTPEESELVVQSLTSSRTPHEASLAHQVCLAHSHPPSHLDRKRKGLAYLSSYGWDPDSRLGLGASGQGIQYPIKVKPKDDKLGIGVVLPKIGDLKKKEKPGTLDAKKIRKLYYKDRRKAERLREMFYRDDDVERYLGNG